MGERSQVEVASQKDNRANSERVGVKEPEKERKRLMMLKTELQKEKLGELA